MFGKKLLSIVSALFLGSQLVSIVNADDCEITYTLGSPDDTCVAENCDIGYYVLRGNDEEAGTIFTINGAGDMKRYVEVTIRNECKGMDGVDYCVDNDGKIFNRKDGLCSANIEEGEDCTSYLNCEKGVCNTNDKNAKPTKKEEGDPNAETTCIPSADEKCAKGYYLVRESALITDTITDDADLWYCSGKAEGDANCVAKTGFIGYYKNAAEPSIFIRCTADGKCVGVTPTGTSCAAPAEGGDVITDTLYADGAKLCIYDGGDQSLTLTKGKNFFVSIKQSLLGLKAAANHFIAVNVDEDGNLTVLNETVRYRYTLRGSNEIHLRAEAKTETSEGQICNAEVTPYEYILDQWTGSEIIDSEKAGYYVNEEYKED